MRKLMTLTAAAALFAASAYAALSSEYADWGKSPAQYLMTKQEVAAWKSVSTDDAAKAFVDLFWARRYPTPATPRNEVREAFDRRVLYADEHFSEGKKTRGSLTERGRALILFGAPKKIERTSRPGARRARCASSTAKASTKRSSSTSPRRTWLLKSQ